MRLLAEFEKDNPRCRVQKPWGVYEADLEAAEGSHLGVRISDFARKKAIDGNSEPRNERELRQREVGAWPRIAIGARGEVLKFIQADGGFALLEQGSLRTQQHRFVHDFQFHSRLPHLALVPRLAKRAFRKAPFASN